MPDIALVVAYSAAYTDGTEMLGLSGQWLRELMQIEFLVIHSFLFLGGVAIPKLKTRKETIAQWSVFCVFLAGYLLFAASAGWCPASGPFSVRPWPRISASCST